TCRRYGIHAQTARQVDQTFEQILTVARQLRKTKQNRADVTPAESEQEAVPEGQESSTQALQESASRKPVGDDPLLRCIMAGFIDQLCVRRDQGTLDCEMTEGRSGTLMRESVVQNAKLFVAASIREVESRGSTKLTLLGLATAIKPD